MAGKDQGDGRLRVGPYLREGSPTEDNHPAAREAAEPVAAAEPPVDRQASGPANMEGSMNVRARFRVRVKGTVYGAPPGRHAQLDASDEERVGHVNDRTAQPEREDGPGRGPEPPRPGSRAFAEAQTDSWILPGEPETGPEPGVDRPQPRPWHETGRRDRPQVPQQQDIPRSPAYTGGAGGDESGRPGPVAMDEDDWEAEPAGSQAAGEYAGRRRGGASLWAGLGVTAALIVLAAAIGLPFLLHSSSPAKPSGEAAGIGAPDNNGDLGVGGGDTTSPTPSGQLGDAASGAPTPTAGPTNIPTDASTADALSILASALAAGGGGGGGGSDPGQNPPIPGLPVPTTTTTTTAPGQPPAPPPPPPPPTTTTAPAAPQPPAPPATFPTTTIQAESGTLSGGASARGTAMCGGATVAGPLGSVTMTVPGSVPTTGTYKVQVFYNNPSIFAQTGTISANGGSGQNFTVGGSVCPASAGTFNVTLHSGTGNKITISGSTFALNIDRIVVSQG
jgi:hypothetical protein